ncbi:MAG: hypothetical protein QOH79_2588 [Acidimicrobiaceae bacterium]
MQLVGISMMRNEVDIASATIRYAVEVHGRRHELVSGLRLHDAVLPFVGHDAE